MNKRTVFSFVYGLSVFVAVISTTIKFRKVWTFRACTVRDLENKPWGLGVSCLYLYQINYKEVIHMPGPI